MYTFVITYSIQVNLNSPVPGESPIISTKIGNIQQSVNYTRAPQLLTQSMEKVMITGNFLL